MKAISYEMQALRAAVAGKLQEAQHTMKSSLGEVCRNADVEAEAYSEVLDLIDEGAKANAEGDELREAEHAKKGN